MGNGIYDLPTVGTIVFGPIEADNEKYRSTCKKSCHSPALLYSSKVPNQFKRAHEEEDAGYDLVAVKDCIIPAGGKNIVFTGLTVSIPKGFVGIVKSRSGLAVKHDIEVGAGVIDPGYRGEIMVLLRNFSDVPYIVAEGDKIGQLLVVSLYPESAVKVADINDKTARGTGGFNSTGYKHGN